MRHAAVVTGGVPLGVDDEPVLLATKLRPPVRRGLLPRPGLVCRLQPTAHRLTVLDAPAGWGKTSLLAEWCATANDVQIAWVALDSGDDHPVLFWSYVLAALRRPIPGIGERALRALPAGGRALRDAALPSLLNELITQPGQIVLVLDDYHVITDRTVHETVSLLVERLPEHVHLVVATRGNPPLPLGRLRAAGELRELRADDLAFDTDEVTRVLTAVPGVDLGADDVDRLARRTEGWPAGVALAAASLAGRGGQVSAFVEAFTGTDRYVLDYLGTEVLAGLPPDLRDFVLHTSILRELSPESCRAVTDRPDSAALLDRAERAGVFLSAIDPGRRWFRYHRLFGELLRHELTLAEPTVVPTLHRRAAAWSTEVGAIGDAVAHHVAAGDVQQAAELVAGCWNEWFNAGRLGSVAAWLDLLPEQLVRADPRLCVARAWLLLDLGRLDEVDRWIAAGDAVGAGNVTAQRDLAVLRATHRFKIGDLGATRGAARRVLELDDGATSFAATVAHLQLGITAFWSGDIPGATRPLAEAVRMARRTGNILAETYGLGYLALAAADSGDLDDAIRRVPLALEPCVDPGVAEHFVAALPHLARATLLAASGRTEGAAEAAARALTLARRGAGLLELALALAVSARSTAEEQDGRRLLDEARRIARACPDPGPLPTRLTRIRVGPGSSRTAPPVDAASAREIALSERERELLPLLAGTLSQREIGTVLHLSLNTVKTHGRVLFRKLGVSSRAEAVARARELGLL
jgi:LuxR family maltose regulon positive regulatory protein